jgi:hypothetical protein
VVSAYLQAIAVGDDPRLDVVLTGSGPRTLEDAFVAVGAAYGARHRISSEAWEAVGVPPDVLAAARISPSSGPPTAPPGPTSG